MAGPGDSEGKAGQAGASRSRVSPYPFPALERVPRAAVRAARRLRPRLERIASGDTLSRALCELVSGDVRVEVRRTAPARAPLSPERAVHLEAADGSVVVVLEPEPDLATLLVARALGRPARLTLPDAPLDEILRGTLAALAVETTRRAQGAIELRARREPLAPIESGIRADVTVRVDGRPYGALLFAALGPTPTRAPARKRSLTPLGELPLGIPLVAAVSASTPHEIASLAMGDVWMPGAGWLHTGGGVPPLDRVLGTLALATPWVDRGLLVRREGGGLVFDGASIPLSDAADVTEAAPESVAARRARTDPATEVLFDTPVSVRVEVGTVTLPASRWHEVRPGDALETGLEIGDRLALRAAAHVVARGELVVLQGELGVRVTERS